MLRLPRLPSNQSLTDDKGYPTIAFQQWWQQVVQQIESGTLNEMATIVSDLSEQYPDYDFKNLVNLFVR